MFGFWGKGYHVFGFLGKGYHVYEFFLQLLSEKFLFLRRIQVHCLLLFLAFRYSVCYCCWPSGTVSFIVVGLQVQCLLLLLAFRYSVCSCCWPSGIVSVIVVGLQVQCLLFCWPSGTVSVIVVGLQVQYLLLLLAFRYSVCYCCRVLMKLEFSRRILKKYSDMNYN